MTPMSKAGAKKILRETAEARHLAEARGGAPWRRWRAYLSERQWGTSIRSR
jgi:hypothetical protein